MEKVFVSYVREDATKVDRLVAHLRSNNIEIWIDRCNLRPGERWKSAIRRAIRNGAFFVACFSTNYAQRKHTFMNEELLLAIEQLRLRPHDQIWFIPVRLTPCELPDFDIGPNGETLRDLCAVDLFVDWVEGCNKLVDTLKPDRSHVLNVGDVVSSSAYVVSRVLRDPLLSARIKVLYDFRCQVCGIRIMGPTGPFAESAHVRPLGTPHRGPDVAENTLCLCPNHHFLLDVGAFGIRDDLSLIGLKGMLRVHAGHTLSSEHLRYHRQHFGLVG